MLIHSSLLSFFTSFFASLNIFLKIAHLYLDVEDASNLTLYRLCPISRKDGAKVIIGMSKARI